MDDSVTHLRPRPTPGRPVGLVALLFGLSGRDALPGAALRHLLGDLGLSDDAARALLSRMRRRGQLTSMRDGRAATYRLAGSYARGFAYIRDRPDAQPPWDGTFHTVLHHVPEEHRVFRDGLRRVALTWGYGVLQPGVLVSPRDRRDRLEAAVGTPPQGVQVLHGRLRVDQQDAARVVRTSWPLEELAEGYLVHVRRLSMLRDRSPQEGPEGLRRFAETVAPALSATLHEPAVPIELMPPGWRGPALRALCTDCSARHGPAATRHVLSVVPG